VSHATPRRWKRTAPLLSRRRGVSAGQNKHRSHGAPVYRRAFLLFVLVLTLAVVASSGVLHEALLNALGAADQVVQRQPIVGMAIFVVLAAASAMFAFVSIAILVPVAVFAWGSFVAVGLLWLGWVLGGLVAYGIGKFLGRPMVRWLAADETVRRWGTRLPADAPLWLIVLLQLALPSEVMGYVLGLLRYPLARYVAALGIAELPYALATVRLGAGFVEGRSGLILAIGTLLVLFSVAAFSILQRAIRSRAEAGTP
jgi:uncharacterized membrane protein YdjX (TVP38/TMEM64 family)